MKKMTKKSKFIFVIVCIGLVVVGVFAATQIYHSRKCHDIIGDGYAMGTDPAPVVIGNTCDQ